MTIEVAGANPQSIPARIEIGVHRSRLGTERTPLLVESLQLVLEAVALWRGVVEGDKPKAKHPLCLCHLPGFDWHQRPKQRVQTAGAELSDRQRRIIAVGADAFRVEQVEAFHAAEQQSTIGEPQLGAAIELQVLQAIAEAEAAHLTGGRLDSHQPQITARPDGAVGVLQDAVDGIAEQTITGGIALEAEFVAIKIVGSHRNTAVGGHPEPAVTGLLDTAHQAADQRFRPLLVVIEMGDSMVGRIDAIEPIQGGDPNPTRAIFVNMIDQVVAQPARLAVAVSVVAPTAIG